MTSKPLHVRLEVMVHNEYFDEVRRAMRKRRREQLIELEELRDWLTQKAVDALRTAERKEKR